MKKKLALIVPSLNGGGAERVIVNLIRNLDQSKFDIKLILIKKEGVYIELIPSYISVIDLKSERVRYSILKLVRELNNYRPDVILSTLGHLNLVLLLIRNLLKGSPRILIREANTPSKSISELSSIKKRAFTLLYRYLYPKADKIIAQCNEMKIDIINFLGIDEKKIRCIYNPIDIDKISKDKQGENPYDISKKNIVAVGRLSFQKGYDILIDAFKIINEKFNNAHLTILGEGILKEKLEAQARDLNIIDNITFVGFSKNPYPYYYYADIYVLSSRWEGFPNTLLEALGCGVKVVSTNCKSGPNEIIGNNEFGILVEEENPIALANGVIQYLNLENKTKDRAYYFSIYKIIKDYEEVLLEKGND